MNTLTSDGSSDSSPRPSADSSQFSLSRTRLLRGVVYSAALSAAVTAFQVASGCYSSEFGGHSDEPSHVTTGLFVFDYLKNPTAAPRTFADDFYCHYPKVGLGHWPPFFYIVQAGWYLVFGASRLSALSLMAAVTSLLAVRTALLVRKYVGPGYALPSACLLVAAPLVQQFSSCVMTEVLLALLLLEASLAYASYLAGAAPIRDGGLFGIVASAAIMTKASALALALLPLLSSLADRKFHRLFTFAFWLPAAIVLVLCGPFYYLTLDLQREGMARDTFSIWYVRYAVPFYAEEFVAALGGGGLLLFAVGAWRTLLSRFRPVEPGSTNEAARVWSTLGGLTVSVLLVCCLVPCGLHERHLLPALVPATVLAARGFRECLAFSGRLPRWRWSSLGSVVLLLMALQCMGFRIYQKQWQGFGRVVDIVLESSRGKLPVCLISSDPLGDGMFVSEAILSRERSGMFALRASKLLASDKWNGRSYLPRCGSAKEVAELLDDVGINYVILDSSVPPIERALHDQQLAEAIAESATRWREVNAADVVRGGQLFPRAAKVYQRVGALASDSAAVTAAIRKIQGSVAGL